jgi:hypothetical protein
MLVVTGVGRIVFNWQSCIVIGGVVEQEESINIVVRIVFSTSIKDSVDTED